MYGSLRFFAEPGMSGFASLLMIVSFGIHGGNFVFDTNCTDFHELALVFLQQSVKLVSDFSLIP